MIDIETPVISIRYKSRASLLMNFGVIVIISALLLILAGAVFGPALKTAFSSTSTYAGGPANDSLASYPVKQNVWAVIGAYEQALGCNKPASTSVAIAQRPDASNAWTENWAVNACGSTQIFKIRFTPDSNNNITFAISR